MPKGEPRGALRCPKCGGHLSTRRAFPTEVNGVPATKRYRRCWSCDLSIPTLEVILEAPALRNSVRRLQRANQQRVAEELARLMAGGSHD